MGTNMDEENSTDEITEGIYVRVFGQLKIFGNRKSLNILRVIRVNSIDEITHHMLQCIQTHLSFVTAGVSSKFDCRRTRLPVGRFRGWLQVEIRLIINLRMRNRYTLRNRIIPSMDSQVSMRKSLVSLSRLEIQLAVDRYVICYIVSEAVQVKNRFGTFILIF